MEQTEARGLTKSTKLVVDNKLADGSAIEIVPPN
jgi:hypothetical protein